MPIHKLTARQVRTATRDGKLPDGGGLYLRVGAGGAHKSWMARVTYAGKRYEVGLGSASLLTLDEARAEAHQIRKSARRGTDPRRARTLAPMTFAEAAAKVHKMETAKSTNPKFAAQWLKTVEDYAHPAFGDRPVSSVGSDDILRVLSPIWTTKHETARRVLQRLAKVFDWAKSAGQYEGENPTTTMRAALPKVSRKAQHHAALPWVEVPKFYRRLSEERQGATSALCLRMIVLAGLRSGEARGARWAEFDMAERTWTIPAERMKSREAHTVPLTGPMLGILDAMRGLHAELVFPSPRGGVMSDQAFARLYARMALDKGSLTTHGFRSTFKDWAAETDAASDELSEAALSHKVGSSIRRAYARSTVLERRRVLMDKWNAYATGA